MSPPRDDKSNRFSLLSDDKDDNSGGDDVFHEIRKRWVNAAGTCVTCDEVTTEGDYTECYLCKDIYHNCSTDKLMGKTWFNTFMSSKTPLNFQFICDVCLTKHEASKAVDQAKRIDNLENLLENKLGKLEAIESKLESLTTLFKSQTTGLSTTAVASTTEPLSNSPAPLYSDKASSILVKKPVDKSAQETLDKTVNVIQNNQFQVLKTKVTSSGDTVVTLPNAEAADKFKTVLKSDSPSSQTIDLKKRKVTISVVGVPSTSPENLLTEILNKNSQLQNVIKAHGEDHNITVNHIRPTRKNPAVNQASLTVSNTARDLISKRNDRLLIGDMSCRVYSVTNYVRRCVKCQGFGHWHKECTAGHVSCANCAEITHETRDCPNREVKKCVNCIKSGKEVIIPHRANSSTCPMYLAERSKASSSTAALN